MRSDLVKCGERVDDLQNGLFVIQDPKKFCFGMDAVLLSGFARVKKGEVALDMGTGTGIIPILLSDRTDGEHFTGLEIQHECAEMADRSVRYNGLEDRVRSSSSVNGAQWIAFTLSRICCGLEAPMSTLVTSSWWSSQPSAISASFSPRCAARSFSLRIWSRRSGVSALSFRNLPSLRIRLSSGIPFR